ncbi:MAG: hypothetical protein QOD72_2088 [Acidimicrobiaceae bacterium]|nr:hypothetical protein [Acidimicrobiaceae bacterium]
MLAGLHKPNADAARPCSTPHLRNVPEQGHRILTPMGGLRAHDKLKGGYRSVTRVNA